MALIEAMACGLPVVATRVDGPSEIIDDGRTGVLVEPGDAAALAAAIERVMRDPELARDLADTGQAHARATYTVDHLVERTATVFERAVA
jgi:glycosyltransferase involved in cell wall biosynthesis